MAQTLGEDANAAATHAFIYLLAYFAGLKERIASHAGT